MGIYDKIKELCKKKGVSVSGVERELGFARGSLCKIDKNKPSGDRIRRLANYFDVPLDYFVEDVKVQNSGQQKVYYQDTETAQLAQEMFEDRDMRDLFDMKKNMSPERFAIQMRAFRDMYRLEHPEEFPEDFND